LLRREFDDLSRLSHGLSDLECGASVQSAPVHRFTGSVIIEWS
jgi:hypothetical protein